MASNKAAWITTAKEYPLNIKAAPQPAAGPGEIVIKNAAVAINPVDWKVQASGEFLSHYPFIMGEDAAGVVESVGAGVIRFKRGDRVIAYCNALMTGNPANSAFQTYTVATEALVSRIPDNLSFEQAVVLPLAISTASIGLFPKDLLNLPLPSPGQPEKTGKIVLIWGGASSVGSCAIQLAVASGATVITTASPANYDFVKSLGADHVFDYRSASVVDDIANALKDTDFAGVYDAIGEDSSFDAVSEILGKLQKKVPVASVMVSSKTTEWFNPVFVLAFQIIKEPNQHIGDWTWKTYVPEALASDRLQAKPDPLVAGHGLEDIQKAMDLQRKGVSAKKVVVTL